MVEIYFNFLRRCCIRLDAEFRAGSRPESNLIRPGWTSTLLPMYENFKVADHWTGEELHCVWKANIVAIATRHADAVDVRFAVNGRPLWIAMPLPAWVEFRKKTGNVITDYLTAQIAGRYLKQAIESGYDNGREMYTMTVEEVLNNLDGVMQEARSTQNLPVLPVMQL
jgi:hypothetical protein